MLPTLFNPAVLLPAILAAAPAAETGESDAPKETLGHVVEGYLGVFVVAFLVTVCLTPVMRHLAIKFGVVDRPSEARKQHRVPVAYLGGVAVFFGILGGIAFSYLGVMFPPANPHASWFNLHPSVFDLDQRAVPWSILIGMTAVMLTGLFDDVASLSPRVKIGGQLLAAAALAMENVGTKVAEGVLSPTIGAWVNNRKLEYHIPLPFEVPMFGASIEVDLIYWAGTAIIAMFVLGACNASNLIDGLDGLLSGVTAIAAAGLLVVALVLAVNDTGPLDSARVILCLALLGACLGFLPHNFNPASIFLGDTGSLLLGYITIVIVLTLGQEGQTHLVVAGLIIYAIPIIDTVLAIVRRKMAGLPISAPDDQHLHHMLKRAVGVKGAAFSLYGLGIVFAALGVWLSFGRVRVVMTIAMVAAAFIVVTAVKIARRRHLEAAAAKLAPPVASAGPVIEAPPAASAPIGPGAAGAPATSERGRPSPVA